MKNINRKIIIFVLFLIIAALLIKGCTKNHTYKYFDFEDASIKNSVGEVTIGLRGSFVLVKGGFWKITHKGSPYKLWIWLKTSQEIKRPIEVSQVEIKYENGSVITTYKGGQFSMEKSSDSNTYHGGFPFDDVNLDHKVISVTLNIAIPTDGKKLEQKIEVELQPMYKEEKRNDFMDSITSA
ncbi:MAG: hypothetical protein PVI90_06975 [Desulfobacteraceae bacterium]|jgi:hypothetical protein